MPSAGRRTGKVSAVAHPSGSSRTLASLFAAGFLAYGVGAYAFTQFLPPLQVQFGWGRAVLGGAMSAFWLAAPLVFVSNALLSRFGLRVTFLVGALCEALGFALLVVVRNPVELYALRFLMGAGKIIIVTPIPIATAHVFGARNGLALAVAFAGWHVGGMVMAPLTALFIGQLGWHGAALALGLILFVGMSVAAWLMPAEVTLRERSALERAVAAPQAVPHGPLNWATIGFATIAFYAGYAALLSHLTPILVDNGLAPGAVASAMGSTAFFALAGALIGGAVSQWLPPRTTGFSALVLMALVEFGASLLVQQPSMVLLGGVVALLGLLIGAGDPILIEALRRAVPPARFNVAFATWYLICLAALAASPFLAGAAFDRLRSYRLAFDVMSVLSIAAALIWWRLLRVARHSGAAVQQLEAA